MLLSVPGKYSFAMKSLPFTRPEGKDDVLVECADGWLSVYRKCNACIHCSGVRVGKRVMPSPLRKRMEEVKRGRAPDEALQEALIMYNTLIRDGNAIECDDDENEGFRTMYQY